MVSEEPFFIGVGGVSLNRGITDYDLEGIVIKRKIMKKAKQNIVLAVNTKFDRVAPFEICDISKIDLIIIDNGLNEKRKQLYIKEGLRFL